MAVVAPEQFPPEAGPQYPTLLGAEVVAPYTHRTSLHGLTRPLLKQQRVDEVGHLGIQERVPTGGARSKC